MSATNAHIGRRRTASWWEPTFNPDLQLVACDWNFETSTGAQKAFLSATGLVARATEGEVFKLNNLTFADCDIQGDFSHSPSILLVDCRFHGCDFAFSSWTSVTFRNCEFRDCSLSFTSFNGCEFRDCTWSRIGFSGNRTNISRSLITNPRSLIRAGFSGSERGKEGDRKHVAYQRFRLAGTKAHVARALLYSHELVGDDKTYYETAKVHDLQQVRARLSESLFQFRHGGSIRNRLKGALVPFWIVEFAFLSSAGFTNGWGERLLQPLLMLLATFVMFSMVYKNLNFQFVIHHPWQKAFDVSILAGFTAELSSDQPERLRLVEGLQLVISILLYTIFFSTVVSRFSRAR